MSTETWEIIKEIGVENVEVQLALQCAPLITGLKISNLFRIQSEQYETLLGIIQDSGIEIYPLGIIEDKITVLLYRKKALEAFLSGEQVWELLKRSGYASRELRKILLTFRIHYQNYLKKKTAFPHEIGLLLGYPPEDVEGFIRHKGKKFLCMGEWKVYKNPKAKQELFRKYDDTRENLVQLLSHGISMEQIIDICDGRMPRNIKKYEDI